MASVCAGTHAQGLVCAAGGAVRVVLELAGVENAFRR